MIYLGSKNRYAKEIIPIINKFIKDNNIKEFYDIFTGGANIADKIICEKIVANDLNPCIISLHKQAQKDFSKIPTSYTKEEYLSAYSNFKLLREHLFENKTLDEFQEIVNMPLYIIGAYENYTTYSHKGFCGSYLKPIDPKSGRKPHTEARLNHYKQSLEENYKKINFISKNYIDLEIPKNAVIYCDPPYKNTTGYDTKEFNHEEYYNWLRKKSKTNPIFISEQDMPKDFTLIWEQTVKREAALNTKKKAVEKLYFIDNR